MLPYNLLLQRTAREALGIDLHNQIVIIDEAHSALMFNQGKDDNQCAS
jgi:chromosome transmission fidelity protein 1